MLLLSVLDDMGTHCDGVFDWMNLNGGKGWDAAINKKPNLHGYGHPNPPNERDRRHREQRRNRPHHSQAGGSQIPSSAANNNLSNNVSPGQQQQISAAQTHQQKLQHLINRPLPPIKQEAPTRSTMGIMQSNDAMGGQGNYKNSPSNYVNGQNGYQYEQQQHVSEEESKGFWSKLCCH